MALPVVIIGGPTACGKSSLAVAIARQFSGTVINADSLQIYRDLGILTAQPTAQERAAVPHDLYAIADANDRYDAMRWRHAATEAIARSHAQARLPVIVGGTGFYLSALLHGLSPLPQVDATHRIAAQKFYADHGLAALAQEVLRHDPALAGRIDTANPQRLMRAHEVWLGTGKPLSSWQALPKSGPPQGLSFFSIVIDPPREDLQRNAALRIALMDAAGMDNEVAHFSARIKAGEVDADAPLTHACGYQPLAQYQDGALSRAAALEAMLVDTRQYAKRQQTWFRMQITPDLRLQTGDSARAAQAVAEFLARTQD